MSKDNKRMTVSRAVLAALQSSIMLTASAACSTSFTPTVTTASVPGASNDKAIRLPAALARDVGRRNPNKLVRVVLQLRYNHRAELERFVDGLERTHGRAYLTQGQFEARYAPTPQEEARTVRILQRSGFRIERRYSDRLLIDATARTGTVERLFSTQIHDFVQPRYGLRSANIRALRIPQVLSTLVDAADASNAVLMHSDIAGMRPLSDVSPVRRTTSVPGPGENAIRNGTFSNGKLSPWKSCGTAPASVSRVFPLTGRYDALTGSMNTKSEPNGWSAICQRIAIPYNAVLSVDLRGITNERMMANAYQEVALVGSAGRPLMVLRKGNENDGDTWVPHSWPLFKYGGQVATLFLGVHGKGRKNHYDQLFIDDVRLVGAVGEGPGDTWGPNNVVSGFDFAGTTSTPNGEGETAAVVIDDVVAPSDLKAYLRYFQISHTGTVTDEPVDGGSSGGSETEVALDVETIASLAPAANVIVYDMPDLSNQSIEDAYNQIVSDGKATVVNSSFGGCETGLGSFNTISDNIALGAAAQGVTFSAASGDQGAEANCSGSAAGVDAPASDPHFVSVGGTQSGSAAGASTSITNPVAWNDSVGAGGGGVSALWTPPPYQQGIPGSLGSGRDVPDIAFPAVTDSVYKSGRWYQVWGTSWASPIYVAMQTIVNQRCGVPVWGTDELYGTFEKSGYQDFIDVVSGNNSYEGVPGFAASTGFDQVSGIGMPLVAAIAIDECGSETNARR